MVIPLFLCTFAPDNEPLKQAGGSASSGLTIRISRQNVEIRRFPVRNLENRVISQTSDKQRKFEISSKVTKTILPYSAIPSARLLTMADPRPEALVEEQIGIK